MLRYSAAALILLVAPALRSQPCDPLPPIKGLQNGVAPEDVREAYRAQRDAHPDDPVSLTQYARALTGTDTPEALKLLERVLTVQPEYPPAHLQMALIYSSPGFHDAAKLKASLESMWKACPASIEGYTFVARTDDEDFMGHAAARLRPLLESRNDDAALASYRLLWTLEFKVAPLAQQDAVRERIRKDSARLRRIDPSQHASVLGELEEAYKKLGDTEGAKWVEFQKPASAGGSGAASAISHWHSGHPPSHDPLAFDRGDYQTRSEELLKQSEEWMREWPDDPAPRMERFNALRSLQDAELEEQVRAAQEWIRVYEEHPSGVPPYMQVADFYNSKNMHFAELPDIVEKGLKELKAPDIQSLSDLSPRTPGSSTVGRLSEWSAWSTAASVYIKTKRYDDARKILNAFGTSLGEYKAATQPSSSDQNMSRNFEPQYWERMAKLAHAEGRRLDEMAYLRSAGQTAPFQSMFKGEPRWMPKVRHIWTDLGGTEDGFQAWMHASSAAEASKPTAAAQPAVVSTAGNWITLDKPLPDFHFSDFQAKTWTPADFRGKVTLITLWATWCEPCRNELPFLQKLYDKARDRSDLQVLTFNVDDDLGLIQPFLTENKYSFPVLSAKDYVDKMLGQWSIPRTWIVDSHGTLRVERVGFGSADDKWVDEVIQAMEKAR